MSSRPKGREEIRALASRWREGGKVRKVYLGPCRKLSRADALQKARAMKKEALGYGKDDV